MRARGSPRAGPDYPGRPPRLEEFDRLTRLLDERSAALAEVETLRARLALVDRLLLDPWVSPALRDVPWEVRLGIAAATMATLQARR